MNTREKEALQTLHLKIIEDLDVKEILPHLYQNRMITFQDYEEFEQLNESRAAKCRRLLRSFIRPGSNCTFNGFLHALRYKNAYSFLADQLEQTYAQNLRNDSSDKSQTQNEIMYEPVRKINVFTIRRKAISALSHKLKRLSHDGDIKTFEKLVIKIDTKFKENKLNMLKNVTERMQLADMKFTSLEAGISAKRVQYDKTLGASAMFRQMESVIPFTSNPRVSSMTYLARYGSDVAMKDSIDEGLAYVQFAKEHAEHVSPCKDTGMVYYIEVNLLSQKYEDDPSDILKTKILNTSEQGIAQFIDENEEVKTDYQRMLLIKMIFCYLGIGLFCRKIEKSKTTKRDIEEAKKIIDFIETSHIWQGMEKRRKMLFHVAKSEFYKQQAIIDLAVFHAKEAYKLGVENHWSAELINISEMVEELERGGRSLCTNSDITEDVILAELFEDIFDHESVLENINTQKKFDDTRYSDDKENESRNLDIQMLNMREATIHEPKCQTFKCKDSGQSNVHDQKLTSLKELEMKRFHENNNPKNNTFSLQQPSYDNHLMNLKECNINCDEPSHDLKLLKECVGMEGDTEVNDFPLE